MKGETLRKTKTESTRSLESEKLFPVAAENFTPSGWQCSRSWKLEVAQVQAISSFNPHHLVLRPYLLTPKSTHWGGGGGGRVDPSEAVVWEKDSVKSAGGESWRKQRETIGYTES